MAQGCIYYNYSYHYAGKAAGNQPGKYMILYITPRHDMLKNVINLLVTAED